MLYLTCEKLGQQRAVSLCETLCRDKYKAHTEEWRKQARAKCREFCSYKQHIGVFGVQTYYTGQTEEVLRGNLRQIRILAVWKQGTPKDQLLSTIEALADAGGIGAQDMVKVAPVTLDGQPLSDATYLLPVSDIKLFDFLFPNRSK